jgi:hypothetical protein
MTVTRPRFNLADSDRAHDEWGANCGPAALAAIMGLTLDEVRPHMGDFEHKGYTNPTLMFDALKSLGANWRRVDGVRPPGYWPRYGLARIQWEGPWTAMGVPMRVRYRQTHWVGSAAVSPVASVFDINCINNGSGWVSSAEWRNIVVPHILNECVPKANGKWHITHAIEVSPPRPSPLAPHSLEFAARHSLKSPTPKRSGARPVPSSCMRVSTVRHPGASQSLETKS